MTQSLTLPLPAARGDVARCRVELAKHSKSFHLASTLLGTTARDEAAAVYAFCRRVDDAIDDVAPRQARIALGKLERELEDVYRGVAQDDPVLRAFQHVALSRCIPREYPTELLHGMHMDATAFSYESVDDLLLYCHRVAGVVGLMMCHVLGVRHERALTHAAHLGMGMQLTNVCRDVVEDWQRGRRYLPLELFAGAGHDALDPKNDAEFPLERRGEFASVVADLLNRADAFYASGNAGLEFLPFRAAVAVGTAGRVYREIGQVLRSRKCDVLSGRAVVSRPRKIALALSAFGSQCARLPRRLRRPFSPVNIHTVVRYPDDVFCS